MQPEQTLIQSDLILNYLYQNGCMKGRYIGLYWFMAECDLLDIPYIAIQMFELKASGDEFCTIGY